MVIKITERNTSRTKTAITGGLRSFFAKMIGYSIVDGRMSFKVSLQTFIRCSDLGRQLPDTEAMPEWQLFLAMMGLLELRQITPGVWTSDEIPFTIEVVDSIQPFIVDAVLGAYGVYMDIKHNIWRIRHETLMLRGGR